MSDTNNTEPQTMQLVDLMQQTIDTMSMTPAKDMFDREQENGEYDEMEAVARGTAAELFDQGYGEGVSHMMSMLGQMNITLRVTNEAEEQDG